MRRKLVSVVVPIYNADKYLKECIESILNQTYKNIELILVNDGSTDNSSKICLEFRKKNNKILYFEKANSGVSNTRNMGILKSNGEYICFVDSDDKLEKEYIIELVKHFEENALVLCNRKKIDNFGNELTNQFCSNKVSYVERKNFIDIYSKKLLNPPFGKLYQRKIILENKIFFKEDLSLGEDLIFNLKYFSQIDKVIFIDKFLYDYRVGNSNSLSNKYYPNMEEIQLYLYHNFSKFFENYSNDKVEREKINFFTTIVSNEFHNNSISFVSRYLNSSRTLNKKIIKLSIQEIYENNGIKFIDFLLLNHNFYIIYILKKKLRKKLKK